VIAVGCYSQLQSNEIAKIEGVDLVLGTHEKFNVFDYFGDIERKTPSCIDNIKQANVFISPLDEVCKFGEALSSDSDSRTRAFLKIQDGCSYGCSYCVVPFARGESRSLEIEKVIDSAKHLIDSGYKEIVLTGVNTGDYLYRTTENSIEKSYKLIDVLYELEKLDIQRIRISSIEPNLLSDEIISLTKSSSKHCSHFHIPLQSGDSKILKLMKRRYNKEFFKNLIHKLNKEIKDVGIGVDVIVGFPGETDAHFQNTYNLLESLPISYLHVFNYSERRNTQAASFPGKVSVEKRKERSQILRNLSDRKKLYFYKRFIGTGHNVLFETTKVDKKESKFVEGFTANYMRVKTSGVQDIENTIKLVELIRTNGVEPIECKIVNDPKILQGQEKLIRLQS
jgi:threonylcarbamoyladenosine tRNA methylthiotransferase MtaB